MNGLHILHFNKTAIKSNQKFHDEMIRLQSNILLVPKDLCTHINSASTTLALLNIRSLRNKKQYIEHDGMTTTCDIICLMETWLNAHITFEHLSSDQFCI